MRHILQTPRVVSCLAVCMQATFKKLLRLQIGTLRRRFGASSPIWMSRNPDYLGWITSWEIFSATPSGNGLSPILKAVPNLSSSQDETFSFAGASFATAVNLSAWGSLMRYLTLL